jgi:hypothetical protein
MLPLQWLAEFLPLADVAALDATARGAEDLWRVVHRRVTLGLAPYRGPQGSPRRAVAALLHAALRTPPTSTQTSTQTSTTSTPTTPTTPTTTSTTAPTTTSTPTTCAADREAFGASLWLYCRPRPWFLFLHQEQRHALVDAVARSGDAALIQSLLSLNSSCFTHLFEHLSPLSAARDLAHFIWRRGDALLHAWPYVRRVLGELDETGKADALDLELARDFVAKYCTSLPPRLLRDEDWFLLSLAQNPNEITRSPHPLTKAFLAKALAVSGLVAAHLPQSSAEWALRDRDLALVACGRHGMMLGHFQDFISDSEVVEAAVAQCGKALRFAAPALRASRRLVAQAVSGHGRALEYAGAYRGDRDIVEAALRSYPSALRYASPWLQDDEHLVSLAVSLEGLALQWASPRLSGRRDICELAVRCNGLALRHVEARLRDRELVAAALGSNGLAARYAPAAFLTDRALALKAVRRSGCALRAFPAFAEDHGVALAAIRQCPDVLPRVPRALREDERLQLACLLAGA